MLECDGPNVSNSLPKMLGKWLEDQALSKLVDIGSFTLDTVSNAFHTLDAVLNGTCNDLASIDKSTYWFESLSPNSLSSNSEDILSTEPKSLKRKAKCNWRITPKRSNLYGTSDMFSIRKYDNKYFYDDSSFENGPYSKSFFTGLELNAFLRLIDHDPVVKAFLEFDKCKKYADKYLIAMVLVYFNRLLLSPKEYTREKFFMCLYLAHDTEEDDEDIKYEIFPWVLGPLWQDRFPDFLVEKEELWSQMSFSCIVSRKTCEEVMQLIPRHQIWSRDRPSHHAGASRFYSKDSLFPKGPNSSERPCDLCTVMNGEINLAESTFESLWDINMETDDTSSDDDENDEKPAKIPTEEAWFFHEE